MKKSLQEIKSLSNVGKRLSLIIDVQDFDFSNLLDMAKITALLGWTFTFRTAVNFSTDEL